LFSGDEVEASLLVVMPTGPAIVVWATHGASVRLELLLRERNHLHVERNHPLSQEEE